MKINYYEINEELAREAWSMSHFGDYVKGSLTAEYRAEVDKAAESAERSKKHVDEEYHAQIDALFDKYCRQLAEYYNKESAIGTRCPSVLISGAGNFPTKKKEKQIAAWDSNYEFYQQTQKILDKIWSVGRGGISSDDENAIPKLQKKLEKLEQSQARMKAINAYYRKNKTLDGCPELTPEQVDNVREDMENGFGYVGKPFATWQLSNNSTNIRRIKQRIEELQKAAENPAPDGWTFNGGEVVMNKEMNRVQLMFDDKPDSDTRDMLKHYGFRWAPSVGAWQRQLNGNGIFAAKQVTQQLSA